MSEWHKAKDEDLEIDVGHGEIDIYVYHRNGYGNVYVIITFAQLKTLYNQITQLESSQ